MTLNRSFRAFVSYCHADRVFAARLQRRLETYRLPRRLAAQVAALPGQATDRIGPIFRDRADLSAAIDLSQAVHDAIAASSALIVVTSPDTVRSHWVDREIALFRAQHPDAPILIAHARGDPTEALPIGLRQGDTEPLAADFRREGDGRRLAFLKIVAGLAGLPLDALVQRDAQRRLRRVTAITLGALIVTLLMAATTIFALSSRMQAVRERRQAEGLVEFMLTDLRTKLRGVGRLDVMGDVNTRAMAYYGAQGDLSRLPEDSLLRRARILQAMGEDDDDADHDAKALTEFREAHRTTEELLARRPNDADRIFAHAQSEFWLGSAAFKVQDFTTARRHFEQYAALARRLIAIDPHNKDWQMESGYAESNLGTLALKSEKRPQVAKAAFARAGSYFESAHRLAPPDQGILHDLADNHGWLADALYDQGKLDQAYAERQREHSLIEGLKRADPGNANYGRDLVESSLGIVRIDIARGHRTEALARLREIHGLVDALASRDTSNKRTARLRAAVAIYRASLIGQSADSSELTALAAARAACTSPAMMDGSVEQQRLCAAISARVRSVSTH
jgi:tetratricopeptide (TPR) repeat protein